MVQFHWGLGMFSQRNDMRSDEKNEILFADEFMKHLQEVADAAVQEWRVAFEASRRAPTPTPEQEIARRLHEARFRELIAEEAFAYGVRPRAIRHLVRDAESVFELRGDVLAARDGRTEPGYPLTPLSLATWLHGLVQSDPWCFGAAARRNRRRLLFGRDEFPGAILFGQMPLAGYLGPLLIDFAR
jgi:hypothetical protein